MRTAAATVRDPWSLADVHDGVGGSPVRTTAAESAELRAADAVEGAAE